MAHLYVLLLVIVSWTWVTTGSVSIPAGSAQKDCKYDVSILKLEQEAQS